jgi:hypothetical protein
VHDKHSALERKSTMSEPKKVLKVELYWVDLVERRYIHWDAEQIDREGIYWAERGDVDDPDDVVKAVARFFESHLRDDEREVTFSTIPSPQIKGGTSLARKQCTARFPLTSEEMRQILLSYNQFLSVPHHAAVAV